MPWSPTDDDKSTLAQVMAWCHQATSHYLGQCWASSMSPYGITRPQWVNSLAPGGFRYSLKLVYFNLISMVNILRIFYEIAIRWMPQHLTDQSTLAVRQQAITWANVDIDICRHMASLSHNELIFLLLAPNNKRHMYILSQQDLTLRLSHSSTYIIQEADLTGDFRCMNRIEWKEIKPSVIFIHIYVIWQSYICPK